MVDITTSDNPQTIVSANPAGTSYVIKAGTHQNFAVTTDIGDGDTFTFEDGAFLDGSESVGSWVAVGDGTWYSTGHTTGPTAGTGDYGSLSVGNKPLEDLFMDGYPLWQVATQGELTDRLHDGTINYDLGPTWWFDGANDRVYVGVDPTNHTFKLSITRQAFVITNADNVTIQAQTAQPAQSRGGWPGFNTMPAIRYYATGVQQGCISASGSSDLTITGISFRGIHGTCIKATSGSHDITVSRCLFNHGGGQEAIVAANCTGGAVRNCEFYFNNYNGVSAGFESGDIKVLHGDDWTYEGLVSNRCWGKSIWLDTQVARHLIQHNFVEDAASIGIPVEAATFALVRNNYVKGCSWDGQTVFAWGAQILNQNTSDSIYTDNVVIYDPNFDEPLGQPLGSHADGLCSVHQNRAGDPSSVRNTYERNTVVQLNGRDGDIITGLSDDDSGNSFPSTDGSNSWDNNTYYVSSTGQSQYDHLGFKTLSAWQALGYDANSSETTSTYTRTPCVFT